jgi:diaminopimelate decarboxylase
MEHGEGRQLEWLPSRQLPTSISEDKILNRSIKMNLSWALLNRLAGEFGDSFYIFDSPRFNSNYREFLSLFQDIYPNSSIAYSYKTNYLPKLCEHVNSAGGYAEVVSEMEYQLALRVGVSPERIIFNGPSKSHAQLESALLAGSIVNLDSSREVEAVEAIAAQSPNTILRIGFRCNFPLDGENISRFGFDATTRDLDLAIDRLRKLSNCDLLGLHCHFSTRNRSLESFALRTSKLLKLCQQYFGSEGPRMIDIGGGFFSPMTKHLQEAFGVQAPSYEQYAAVIAPLLANAYPYGNGPELILEPGAALVADTMLFVARIIELKKIASRRIAIAAGSIHNIKPTLHNKNMPVRIFSACESSNQRETCEPTDIVGYTCMEHDCLHRGYDHEISPGDYAVFENVGAYTIVMKPPFIQPSPAIVAINATSPGLQGFELAKRREEVTDLFSTYIFQ